MPVLPDPERADIVARFMQETSALGEPLNLLKGDIRPVVNALDDWRVANAAAANQAIPLPGRTALTMSQKSRLMTMIFYEAYQADVETV